MQAIMKHRETVHPDGGGFAAPLPGMEGHVTGLIDKSGMMVLWPVYFLMLMRTVYYASRSSFPPLDDLRVYHIPLVVQVRDGSVEERGEIGRVPVGVVVGHADAGGP